MLVLPKVILGFKNGFDLANLVILEIFLHLFLFNQCLTCTGIAAVLTFLQIVSTLTHIRGRYIGAGDFRSLNFSSFQVESKRGILLRLYIRMKE